MSRKKSPLQNIPDTEFSFFGAKYLNRPGTFKAVYPPVFLHPFGQTAGLKLAFI
jgi:hypothetical protein